MEPKKGALESSSATFCAGATTHPLLEARGVIKRFRGREVLCGAAFAGSPGQLIGILGENGSGKSTLLSILAGRTRMDCGEVIRRAPLGYCPQEAQLYPYLTVGEHFSLFGRAYRISAPRLRERVEQLLETFRFRGERERLVAEVSGGTRQKLNLAIALLSEPKLLLLDEPYAGLDIESYRAFVAWTRQARERGTCIVLATHLLVDTERSWFDVLQHLRGGVLHAQSS